jgi:hypothetical protein
MLFSIKSRTLVFLKKKWDLGLTRSRFRFLGPEPSLGRRIKNSVLSFDANYDAAKSCTSVLAYWLSYDRTLEIVLQTHGELGRAFSQISRFSSYFNLFLAAIAPIPSQIGQLVHRWDLVECEGLEPAQMSSNWFFCSQAKISKLTPWFFWKNWNFGLTMSILRLFGFLNRQQSSNNVY